MDTHSPDDRLSISLDSALNRVQEEARVNGNNAVRSYLFIALIVFLVLTNGIPGGKLPRISVLLLIIMVFVMFTTWKRIWYARKLLRFYGKHGVPALVLDAEGISCPIILMDYISKAAEYLMQSGHSILLIKWHDIARWTVTIRSQRLLSGLYLLDLNKESVAPELAAVAIKRDFSDEQEQAITQFAQQFLTIPVGPLPTKLEDGEPRATRWGAIYLAMALGVAVVVMNLMHSGQPPLNPVLQQIQGSR